MTRSEIWVVQQARWPCKVPLGYLLSLFAFVCFWNFTDVQLLCRVTSVSTEQQSRRVLCVCTSCLFWISFPFRSPESAEESPPCRAAGPHQLWCHPQGQWCVWVTHSLPVHPTPTPSLVVVPLFSTSVSLFLLCEVLRSGVGRVSYLLLRTSFQSDVPVNQRSRNIEDKFQFPHRSYC